MFEHILNSPLVMVNPCNGMIYHGQIVGADGCVLKTESRGQDVLEEGMLLQCAAAAHRQRFLGTVDSGSQDATGIWVTTMQADVEPDRHPRVKAGGFTGNIAGPSSREVFRACNISESGLLVTVNQLYSLDSEVDLQFESGQAPISMKAKVVRHERTFRKPYGNVGMMITDIDRVNFGRWRHLIQSLSKRG